MDRRGKGKCFWVVVVSMMCCKKIVWSRSFAVGSYGLRLLMSTRLFMPSSRDRHSLLCFIEVSGIPSHEPEGVQHKKRTVSLSPLCLCRAPLEKKMRAPADRAYHAKKEKGKLQTSQVPLRMTLPSYSFGALVYTFWCESSFGRDVIKIHSCFRWFSARFLALPIGSLVW